MSFFEARNTVTPTRFVGWANYSYLLHDRLFLNSLVVFVAFAAFIVPLTYVCSLGLALLLDKITIGRAFFRSVFFIPTAVSYVIAAIKIVSKVHGIVAALVSQFEAAVDVAKLALKSTERDWLDALAGQDDDESR